MRLAIVTGGSRGLGYALCERFHQHGFTVIEFSRSAPHPYSVTADLANPESAIAQFRRAVHTVDHSRVAELIVVNNAATIEPIGTQFREHAQTSLTINFTSAIVLMSAILSHFRATACRKVLANITSGAAVNVYRGLALYCASKAGVEHFIRSVACDQQREAHPFTAINIDPGVIDTDMQARLRATTVDDLPDVSAFLELKANALLVSAEKTASAVFDILLAGSLLSGERYRTCDAVHSLA